MTIAIAFFFMLQCAMKPEQELRKHAKRINDIAAGVDLDTVCRALNTSFRDTKQQWAYKWNWTFELHQMLTYLNPQTNTYSSDYIERDRSLEQNLTTLFQRLPDNELSVMNLATNLVAFDMEGNQLGAMVRSDDIPLYSQILEARQREISPVPGVYAEIKRNNHNLGSFVSATAGHNKVDISAKGHFFTMICQGGAHIWRLDHAFQKEMEKILKLAVLKQETAKLRRVNISQPPTLEQGKY
jgi:hypothetical protein